MAAFVGDRSKFFLVSLSWMAALGNKRTFEYRNTDSEILKELANIPEAHRTLYNAYSEFITVPGDITSW